MKENAKIRREVFQSGIEVLVGKGVIGLGHNRGIKEGIFHT